jgi:hypothetical protein
VERERVRLAAEAAERERVRLAAETAKREKARLAAEAAAERARLEAEAAAEQERVHLAAVAAKREKARLEAEAAAAERERLHLAAEAAKHEKARLEAEAAEERQRLHLAAEAAKHERARLEAEAAAARERLRRDEAARIADDDSDVQDGRGGRYGGTDAFADFRIEADERRRSLLSLLPMAFWAPREAPKKSAQAAEADTLRDLIAGLSLPHVAGVRYATGCRIRRVRVPVEAPPRARGTRPVIVSRRVLDDARGREDRAK